MLEPKLVRVGDLDIAYEEVGSGEPLVLVMGIGAQMLWWPDGFCSALADAGFRVVRFDNRDIGLSTNLSHLPVPNPVRVMRQRWLRQPVDAPYGLADMARDTVGLMDVLGIDRAHVAGASMGGMIAQHVAFEHPTRVTSLTSIMSTTGAVPVSLPHPRALQALFAGRPMDVEAAVEAVLYSQKALGSRGIPRDEARIRATARRCIERGVNPKGFLRQWGAIMASGDRTTRLATIRAPTLVLHGTIDPLVPPAGGRATAKAIPGARLVSIENMGHDLPEGAWPQLVSAIRQIADEGSSGARDRGG